MQQNGKINLAETINLSYEVYNTPHAEKVSPGFLCDYR